MKKKSAYIQFISLLTLFGLISCYDPYAPVGYIEGNIIEDKNYFLEYVSIEYQEEITIINLKIDKKNDEEVILNSAKAEAHIYEDWSKTEDCVPLSIYFNEFLQNGVENLLIFENPTYIKIIYPIMVKNGDVDLKISGKYYNLWIETREHLEGKEASTKFKMK